MMDSDGLASIFGFTKWGKLMDDQYGDRSFLSIWLHQSDIEKAKPELNALTLDRVNELKHHSLVTNVDYYIAIAGKEVRAIIEFELCGVPMEHQLIAIFGYNPGSKDYHIYEYNTVRDCNLMECLRTGGAKKEERGDERFELE